ncbi:MAG: serine/threonine-protein kinase, partial [Rhodothermales bacterium]|nr:serine/threonine-protein kinase [Rhodothermales bacterium]
GCAAFGVVAVFAVPGIIAGWGLLARKPWGRVIGIVVAILDLFNIPIGTAFGIYALWVLTEPEAEAYFDHLRRASAALVPGILDPSQDQPHAPTDLLIGNTVSHYYVESLLGSGGMGVVYRAMDTRLRRPVALKVLAPELTRDDTAKHRFVLEARVASSLESDHICTIYDIGQTTDGRTFMAMAYYEGETLREKLIEGPLGIDVATRYAIQIGRGLHAAHLKGIVHRDIKPANVMITADDTVKLLDFGLVKLADQALTADGRALGTVAYMSPEQARGEEVDPRSDLWSLGAVLYEMLSARRPFNGDNSTVVLNAIQHLEPQPLDQLRPDTPAWLANVVQRLLSKESSNRYASAADLCSALEGPNGSTLKTPAASSDAPRPASDAARDERSSHFRLGNLLALASLAVRPPLTHRIAVIPFENRTGQNALDAFGLMVADSLVEVLLETKHLEVIPVVTVLGVLKRASDPESAIMDLVRRTRTGTVIAGSFYRRGEYLEIRSQTMNVRRREVVGTTTPVRTPMVDPASGIGLLQDAVMIMLAEQFDPLRQLIGSVDGKPPSYDAYRAIVSSFG